MKLDRRIFWLFFLALSLLILLVPFGLVSAQGMKVDLTLFLAPGNYSNNLTPGQDNVSYLEVRNNGSQDIMNIRFSANAPPGWTVNITPESLAVLGSGSSNTVNVDIIPAKTADSGNYIITLFAQANETRAVTTAYLTVKGGTSFWLWVGVAIAAVVIIGFVIVFRRFGRPSNIVPK